MQKTNQMTTLGGILAATGVGLIGAPLVVLTAYAQIVKDGPPSWFNMCVLPMMLLGVILGVVGNALTGVASKGQDEQPTIPQVNAATFKQVADEAVKDAAPKNGGKTP